MGNLVTISCYIICSNITVVAPHRKGQLKKGPHRYQTPRLSSHLRDAHSKKLSTPPYPAPISKLAKIKHDQVVLRQLHYVLLASSHRTSTLRSIIAALRSFVHRFTSRLAPTVGTRLTSSGSSWKGVRCNASHSPAPLFSQRFHLSDSLSLAEHEIE